MRLKLNSHQINVKGLERVYGLAHTVATDVNYTFTFIAIIALLLFKAFNASSVMTKTEM